MHVKNQGFTLLELIVVVIIFGVGAAIVLPNLFRDDQYWERLRLEHEQYELQQQEDYVSICTQTGKSRADCVLRYKEIQMDVDD